MSAENADRASFVFVPGVEPPDPRQGGSAPWTPGASVGWVPGVRWVGSKVPLLSPVGGTGDLCYRVG